jgi:hypothetical protein
MEKRNGCRNGTSEFSRPPVPTFRIQTGPQAHLRYGHFAAGDRPAHDRFGILALTLWTGHTPLHAIENRGKSITESEEKGLAISLVHRRQVQILDRC